MSKKIIVFGATGATGKRVVSQALDRGHGVTAFVRDPARLTISHPGLSVVQGDLADAESIDAALAQGGDAVISTLGLFSLKPTTIVSEGTARIIGAMQRHGVQRLLVVSSIGVGDSAGHGNFLVRMIQRTSLKQVLADKERQEAAIRESDLDWTVLRPPRLVDNPEIRKDQILWQAEQPTEKVSWATSTGSVANMLLDALENDRYLREAVNFSDPK